MIRLGELFPGHLNLNGDLGNTQVIQQELAWRGIASTRVVISSAADLDQSIDFIIVGHGSEAAWADIEQEFAALIPDIKKLVASGIPLLAISTGYEMSIKHGLIKGVSLAALPNRVSKFEVALDGNREVLGYLNTEADIPTLHREGNLVATTLHGPVLSRNPILLVELLTLIVERAGLPLPSFLEAKKADQLAGLIAEVWKLETELANE
ncbi:MAG: hypothetical protein ACKOUD_04025 [Rhodoluna sp.]